MPDHDHDLRARIIYPPLTQENIHATINELERCRATGPKTQKHVAVAIKHLRKALLSAYKGE
jgi:hypothetical protein